MEKNQKSLKEQYIEMQQNAFMREVNEDVRNEKIFSIWNKYKYYIITLIIIVLAITISKNIYEANKEKVSMQQALQIEKIMSDTTLSNKDKISSLHTFATNAKYGYRDIAYFNIYSMQLAENNINDAIATLKILINSSTDTSFENLAILKLTSLLSSQNELNDSQFNEIKDMLESISSREPFYFSAQYVLGTLYLARNNTTEAKKIFEDISNDEMAPIGIKSQSINMLNLVKSKSVK